MTSLICALRLLALWNWEPVSSQQNESQRGCKPSQPNGQDFNYEILNLSKN